MNNTDFTSSPTWYGLGAATHLGGLSYVLADLAGVKDQSKKAAIAVLGTVLGFPAGYYGHKALNSTTPIDWSQYLK